jgi:hypothetical protein
MYFYFIKNNVKKLIKLILRYFEPSKPFPGHAPDPILIAFKMFAR